MSELGGEKIDIIQWNPEIDKFLAASLSPAKEVKIEIVSDKKQIATAILPDDQLSLAIGRDGQNVRLAARLTGWKIDIKGQKDETEAKVEEDKKTTKEETSKTDVKADDKKKTVKVKKTTKAKKKNDKTTAKTKKLK